MENQRKNTESKSNNTENESINKSESKSNKTENESINKSENQHEDLSKHEKEMHEKAQSQVESATTKVTNFFQVLTAKIKGGAEGARSGFYKSMNKEEAQELQNTDKSSDKFESTNTKSKSESSSTKNNSQSTEKSSDKSESSSNKNSSESSSNKNRS
ncbi:hypothetical protein NEPAR06_0188 [Nematocida parisii]|uniref:Uncharacterized protein n=1 Tax=Nematocida parisii (strain ERTm3) TaxID=935791 RepID=I3EDE5_NEMP3|nr:uncharacterized protein NEPG_00584 [Nematocida parisii ERTm1]EIJ87242.1 hypothetical protein NEQG_02577 [Nematocida parisii ERTm3]KAI5126625.1 hypothetical protein NEPAR08_0544 [Nematocida parisii]EIJ95059.1 hypothetical protein NEPG_00584 [Nematocida parisii ERTm1]KAI5127908.1 hypothetical protein NEPAR03_1188 [Nematocida parisii]KAI5142846.1 hypothetical protein NEPAR04_1666 [Nematocida parisii]|eukprot:XP_013058415.1 hypothetical protein NEPG_00584 [Nematocida parisii ERTm1]